MNKLLSIYDIEEVTGIPKSTVRRYIKHHQDYIQTTRKGNLTLVYASEIPVLETIRLHCEDGKNHIEISAILAKEQGMKSQSPDQAVAGVEDHVVDGDGGRGALVADKSHEALLALQSGMESIEKKQMKLLEDLMSQVKRVEESKEFAINLLEKQLKKKNETIQELESKIRGYEILLSQKESAPDDEAIPEETTIRGERAAEKKTLYSRFFNIHKTIHKNA